MEVYVEVYVQMYVEVCVEWCAEWGKCVWRGGLAKHQSFFGIVASSSIVVWQRPSIMVV